jgi:hypothetical protein
MSRVVVVLPLRSGTHGEARELVEAGPPYDLSATNLHQHSVYLTEHEAVFVFEGPNARGDVERLLGDPAVMRSAGKWQSVLADRPRIATEAFAWSRI